MFLEYCPDGDLRAYLKKNKNKLEVSEAIKFFQDIVNGFKILYENKIIHRDIKPANIMLNKGNCLITDFGFARCLEEIDMEKLCNFTLLGTPLYMSP
jgi:serine/threonine-protein kinase ULK/ATG1